MKLTSAFVAIALVAVSMVHGAPVPVVGEDHLTKTKQWRFETMPVNPPETIATDLANLRAQQKVTEALQKINGNAVKPVPEIFTNDVAKTLDKSESELRNIKSPAPEIVSNPVTPENPHPSKIAMPVEHPGEAKKVLSNTKVPINLAKLSKKFDSRSSVNSDKTSSATPRYQVAVDDLAKGEVQLRETTPQSRSQNLLQNENGYAKPTKKSMYQRLRNYFRNYFGIGKNKLGNPGTKTEKWKMSSIFSSDGLLGKIGKLGKSAV